MKLFYISLILLLFSSCKENPYKKAIVGDWKLVSEEHDPDLKRTIFDDWSQTFLFYPEDSIIVGNGYRQYRWEFRFVGTKTIYKIKKDSLFVFSLSDSIWQKRKIKRITRDSLILQNEANRFEKYVKIHYTSGKKQFDKIILTTSGCFGSCPVMSVQLERNGNFYFIGHRYTERKGFFKAKVPSYLFDRLMKNLDNVDVLKLNEEPIPNDAGYLSFAFLKNDTIVKNIRYINPLGTPEFQTAVRQLMFLYRQLKLDSITEASIPLFECRNLTFEKNGKHLELFSALRFLLWTELLKSKPANTNPLPRLELQLTDFREKYYTHLDSFIDLDLKGIKTDGRFYQFIFKTKPTYTMDLGYNFLDRYLKGGKFKRDVVFSL